MNGGEGEIDVRPRERKLVQGPTELHPKHEIRKRPFITPGAEGQRNLEIGIRAEGRALRVIPDSARQEEASLILRELRKARSLIMFANFRTKVLVYLVNPDLFPARSRHGINGRTKKFSRR